MDGMFSGTGEEGRTDSLAGGGVYGEFGRRVLFVAVICATVDERFGCEAGARLLVFKARLRPLATIAQTWRTPPSAIESSDKYRFATLADSRQ